MSEFTLGPWRAVESYDAPRGGRLSLITIRGTDEIGQLTPRVSRQRPEEARANARLIAAAPDLYRACALMCLGPAHPDWARHVAEARAAIAKVEDR
jgi:hypothetical protein